MGNDEKRPKFIHLIPSGNIEMVPKKVPLTAGQNKRNEIKPNGA
jgi:hypothetical protein